MSQERQRPEFAMTREIAKENIFYRRNLPHIHPRDGIFFITFRLVNSLPIAVIKKIKQEREQQIKLLEKKFSEMDWDEERYKVEKRYFAKFDNWLDKDHTWPEMIERGIHCHNNNRPNP